MVLFVRGCHFLNIPQISCQNSQNWSIGTRFCFLVYKRRIFAFTNACMHALRGWLKSPAAAFLIKMFLDMCYVTSHLFMFCLHMFSRFMSQIGTLPLFFTPWTRAFHTNISLNHLKILPSFKRDHFEKICYPNKFWITQKKKHSIFEFIWKV